MAKESQVNRFLSPTSTRVAGGRHWSKPQTPWPRQPAGTEIPLQKRATVSHEIEIERAAAQVWELVGAPSRIHEWFPGITASEVAGDRRYITNRGGHRVQERILEHDVDRRRFEYELLLPVCTFHRGVIEVHEIASARCRVVYRTEAEPAALALAIGGAAGAALDQLRATFPPEG